MYKVLIVDDSKFMRHMLKTIINNIQDFETTGEADNGEKALELLNTQHFDVITLDVEMPILNGLETLKRIVELPKHIPVLMFSSRTKEGTQETIEALTIGAVDFLTKPDHPSEMNAIKHLIENKLKEAVVSKRAPKVAFRHPVVLQNSTPTKEPNNVVLIGCSTGGPKSLRNIIPQIPENVPAAFVIVQHMPAGNYIKSLADNLNKKSSVKVTEVSDNQLLKKGHVYIIPGGKNGIINSNFRISLTEKPIDMVHKPSVDILFESGLSLVGKTNVVGVILTGMGSDGTKGSIELKQNGCKIIAESEESAVVYGMPKKVVESGSANEVLRLELIIPTLLKRYLV